MQYNHLRKTNTILIFIAAILLLLYVAEGFLVPLVFAIFVGALAEPMTDKFEKIGINNFWASLASTLIVFIAVGGIAYLLIYQLSIFAGDFQEIRERLQDFYHRAQQQFYDFTGISPQKQKEIISNRSASFLDVFEQQLTYALGNIFTASAQFLLVLIYVFLFLLNRDKYYKFFLMNIPDNKQQEGKEILTSTKKVAHKYLWGRIQVMTILAIMYIITFTLFDVPYALLLTLFGAIITIIPYLGPFISGLLPILIVIIFGREFSEIIFFSSIVMVIQLIESYVLEPFIIGSEVRLSPLAVIIAVIVGGTIWGVAGMILFVPIFAILKIIGSYTPELKPIAFLIGNENGKTGERIKNKIKNLFN